ncbi:hypothetical protein SVAN01_03413 [Stagonosporopsis vannaccii]|nr:hypothetical protein SVAN01_03413 [Stagonosporopsis vannaccii]
MSVSTSPAEAKLDIIKAFTTATFGYRYCIALCQVTHLTAHKLSARLRHRRCVPYCAAVHPKFAKTSLLPLSQTIPSPTLPRGSKNQSHSVPSATAVCDLQSIVFATQGLADVDEIPNSHANCPYPISRHRILTRLHDRGISCVQL